MELSSLIEYPHKIRSIQHYLYCPHRWGLIEFDCSFAENVFVYKGNLVHSAVDNNKGSTLRGSKRENSVHVYNDEWGIVGIVDCLEFKVKPEGTFVPKWKESFDISIVEYKASAPKNEMIHYDDKMQLLAQKICIDNLFNTDCNALLYYADTKKRFPVNYIDRDYIFLRQTLKEMDEWHKRYAIPPIEKTQNCNGCSMKDICLPMKRVIENEKTP